ncbi:capsular polysaccharide export protein, LipB/KpsS family [Brevibacillus centrosporus]|uniref:capsular polysaccharide export protein, LipB/KpsS family n=1 Tax=Brevibacillus centrosporus TaxID=54910 RepID=UPI00380AE1AE
MSEYMLNFHSLSLDFVERFKSVQYKGIPLALFYNFYYGLVANESKALMKEKSFREPLKIRIEQEHEIQKSYDAIMDPIMQPARGTARREGKVLLYDYVLAAHSFVHYLDPQRVFTMNHDNVLQILAQYHVEKSEIKQSLMLEAKKIFDQCATQPFLSNGGFQHSILDSHFPTILNLMIQVENLFDRVPISCVIVGTTVDPISRILCVMAGQRGIPSINMQHGVISVEEQFMPVYATKTAVLGHYEKEWYLKRGVVEHRLAITGHPRHDVIFAGAPASKASFQKRLGLNQQKKTVLITSQEDVEIVHLTHFIENLALNCSPNILIKPHPHEYAFQTIHIYNHLLRLPGVQLVNELFYHLLPHVDLVVVVGHSTTGLEGMLANKPVLCFKKEKPVSTFIDDFYDAMGSFTQSNPNKLAEMAIPLLLGDASVFQQYRIKRDDFVKWRYPKQNATKELFDLLYQLTGTSYINPANRPPF